MNSGKCSMYITYDIIESVTVRLQKLKYETDTFFVIQTVWILKESLKIKTPGQYVQSHPSPSPPHVTSQMKAWRGRPRYRWCSPSSPPSAHRTYVIRTVTITSTPLDRWYYVDVVVFSLLDVLIVLRWSYL